MVASALREVIAAPRAPLSDFPMECGENRRFQFFWGAEKIQSGDFRRTP
jgi:hypothetical protein